MKLIDTIDKVRVSFYKDKSPYIQLYRILGFYPHDISLYREALRHRSCVGGKSDKQSNERLEFLGDAVLGAVVAQIVYQRYQNRQEGFLTTLRSKLVKRETLNRLAVEIGLDKLVIHSDFVHVAHNNYINGNAFEAFVGAIYLDRGYEYCVRFMEEQIFTHYINIDQACRREENYKSKLIEWCQKYQCQFEFVVVDERMESGNTPKFVSEVTIEGVVCGKGVGYSKKESHQQAAQCAYDKVKNNISFVNNLFDLRNQRVSNA